MAQAVKVKDYKQLALDILELVGGAQNIDSAARCATRLRLVLHETPADAHEKVAALPGVITVVEKGGQFQVVIGPHVGDVFEALSGNLNLAKKEEQPKEKAEKQSLLNRLIQIMSATFAPICYVLAGAGLIQGVLIILSSFFPSIADTGAYQIFDLISLTPFTFLPVLIAVTASRHFQCNTFIAVACCLALVNPSWTDMVSQMEAGTAMDFFGIPLTANTYTSSVLPPLILVGLLSILEKWLRKHLPEIVKSLLTPVICLAIMVPVTFVVIGPVFQGLSNLVAAGYNALYSIAPPVAAAVVGGLWEVIVIFGIHWGMVPIVIANFDQFGFDSIQIFIQMAVISQMAAAFGIFLKSKDKNLKTLSLSSVVTAIFGITEPTIYGVTLPRKKAFVIASLWFAVGSVAASLFGAVNYVYAGLPGLITSINAIPTQEAIAQGIANNNSFLGMAIGAGITIVGTIVTILLVGYESKRKKEAQPAESAASLPNAQPTPETNSIPETTGGAVFSPLNGQVRPLSQVNDPTFAEEILGKGVAIFPEEGKLYAPFDGQVASVMDTRHAVNLISDSGLEVLIHIGLETVRLNGKYFTAKVKDGDRVKKGDLLIEFNLVEIGKEYDLITPVVVVNADEFSQITPVKLDQPVRAGEQILTVT